MKNFIVFHFGFEQPTLEDMEVWNNWFTLISDRQVEKGGLRGGQEITPTGTIALPFGKESLTGYTIIQAQDMDEAVKIASQCPIVASTQVYEIMGG